MDRRQFMQIGTGAGLAVAAGLACSGKKEVWQNGISQWPLCLNTSTIRPAGLKEKINAAAEAGFDGIELWINELEKYDSEGGDLKTLGTEIRDRGLFVHNIIGLWDCMPMDEDAWQKSLAPTRERMRMSAAVGAKHAAAIPTPDRADFDLKRGAERYRELLHIGREEFGLIPAFEFVGFFKGVHRLGQAAAIALDADDPDACLVMDTFHLFRGDSGFQGIQHLNGKFIANFHWNDVPENPPREAQRDKHRIYPGDGVLPLVQVLKDLKSIDYHGPLSLEIFHREYWKQDPLRVAKTGLEKMCSLIQQANE